MQAASKAGEPDGRTVARWMRDAQRVATWVGIWRGEFFRVWRSIYLHLVIVARKSKFAGDGRVPKPTAGGITSTWRKRLINGRQIVQHCGARRRFLHPSIPIHET